MNQICNEYCKMINGKFSNYIKTIIIYGSNIYNESSSDLDVCIIVNNIDLSLQEKMINETILFHKKNKLKVDEEIPYRNKLIYTVDEIEETLSNSPFYKNGKLVVNDIKKTEEFLSSKEMKKRLLLNILTTDHLSIGESTVDYEKRAFKIILNTIIDYFKIEDNSEEKILECMYTNKYTGAFGEMYLGYKRKYQEKEKYLKRKIHEALND